MTAAACRRPARIPNPKLLPYGGPATVRCSRASGHEQAGLLRTPGQCWSISLQMHRDRQLGQLQRWHLRTARRTLPLPLALRLPPCRWGQTRRTQMMLVTVAACPANAPHWRLQSGALYTSS